MRGLPVARAHLARAATIAAVVLSFGTLPGAVARPIVFERVVLRLPPSPDHDLEVTVHVRSQSSGNSVAGARVRVLSMVEGRAYLAGSGETSADGEVRLGGLPRSVAWILADAEGYARASTQRALDGSGLLEMALPEGHALAVAVRDDLGEPVAGAEVEVSAGDPLPVGARTGADGRVTVTRVAEAPWTLAVHAPGYEDVVRRGVHEGETPAIVLRKLAALLVTVLGEQGKPAPLAHVQVAGTSLWPARTTDTSTDGTIRIGGLSAGSYALRASSAGLVTETDLGIPLARGEERSVTLTLARGVFAMARVVDGDGDDASPIAKARVTLVESGLSPFPLEALSDETGSVRLGPVVAGPALLTAQAEGFVPRGGVEMPADGHAVTLVMARAGTLEGRVFDGKGRPVDGATLAVVGTSLAGGPIEDDPRAQTFRKNQFDANLLGVRALVPSGELGVVPGPVPGIPRAMDLPPPSGGVPGSAAVASLDEPWVSREDGTFHLSPVSPGRVRVVVRHPEFLEALSEMVTLVPGGEGHVDIVLHEGGTLEGRVVDGTGRPVADASVTVTAQRGSTERGVRTASDGTFAFAALPEGIIVTASLGDDPDARLARATVSVPEGGKTQVTLTLPEARLALDLRVKDDRGYPVGAAQVAVGSIDPATPFRTTVFTDEGGEASVPGARGIALRLEVTAPGHAMKSVEVAPTEASAQVALDPAETVVGTVREARSGTPIKGAEVTLYATAGVERTATDAEGGFKLRDVTPGAAKLRVRAAERVTLEQEVKVESTTSGTLDVGKLDLAEEAVVEGTVVDARGDPVPGARVGKDRVQTYLPARAPRDGSFAVTDARGRFHLGGLGDGDVTLEAYAPDLGRGRVEGVHANAGRTTGNVTVRLEPGDGEKGTDSTASGGVAVTLGEVGGDPPAVVVIAVADGSEAERAGLAAGDAVLAVDGETVASTADARGRLSGPVGHDVVVTRRRGELTESLRVPREPVHR